MPKKFGINTKSAEAKERKEEGKKAKKENEQRVKEDKMWEDNDKAIKAKEDRKREQEEKKIKEKERKEENKRLAELEASQLSKKTKPTTAAKKTRSEIEQARQAAILAMQAQVKKEQEIKEKEIEDTIDKDINPNHIYREEQKRLDESGAVLLQGSGIDDALELTQGDKIFKHPEKKVKQAWKLYIEDNLQRAKHENPGLKRSQLLDILHKEFEKSEKNPFNQNFVDYNSKLE